MQGCEDLVNDNIRLLPRRYFLLNIITPNPSPTMKAPNGKDLGD